MSRKVEQLLGRIERKRSERKLERDLLAASPSLRAEYFAIVRSLDS